MRSFTAHSALVAEKLNLALAPALTPTGFTERPEFFSGFTAEPLVFARGLLVLADVASTRYFQPSPTTARDPICTANGDRMRFESFSACNTTGVRLDLLSPAFDGGTIAHGTTNVDINIALRQALTTMPPAELLHVSIGRDELRVSTPSRTHVERQVSLPTRWLSALGSAQELTQGMDLIGEAPAAATRQFLATLPNGRGRSGQWTISRLGIQPALRPGPGALYAEGLNRLAAAKRLALQITGLRVYGTPGAAAAASVWEFAVPNGRLTFTLTAEHYRGFSGEGALLTKLAADTAGDDADLVATCLAFEPRIDIKHLSSESGLVPARVESALAVLASDGRVGYDLFEEAYYHRELPSEGGSVTARNPRLKHAHRLLADGAVAEFEGSPGVWRVRGNEHLVTGGCYIVRLDPPSCTCEWWRSYEGSRGACKHVLAAQLMKGQHD